MEAQGHHAGRGRGTVPGVPGTVKLDGGGSWGEVGGGTGGGVAVGGGLHVNLVMCKLIICTIYPCTLLTAVEGLANWPRGELAFFGQNKPPAVPGV